VPRKYLLNKICAECEEPFKTKHLHQETCSRKCGVTLLRSREMAIHEKNGVLQVWACGGGVQSTAIALLIYTGKLPIPDYAWIVDVGYEKSKTFKYVESVISPKLSDVGVKLEIIKTTDYFDNTLFDSNGHVKLPLYEKGDDGIIRKYKTQCSGLWKKRVAHRWLREKGVQRCDTWIGISIDENRRVKKSPVKWNQNRYPLVDLGIRREDCIDLIARFGWPKPEHTSCYLCPNQSDFQWQDLKENYTEDWSKAIQADEYIRSVKPTLYLHSSCIPIKDRALSATYSNKFYVGKECFGDCEAVDLENSKRGRGDFV